MAYLRRILVASDLSPRADDALARAAQLAMAHQATTLTVLHVLTDLSSPEKVSELAIRKAKEALRQKVEPLTRAHDLAVTMPIAIGTPFVEILRWTSKERADLIVMGAPVEHNLAEGPLRTTVEQVVRRGGRAVLAVKQPAHKPYQRVLVAVDFSAGSQRALELALNVAPQAEFHVLHVYEPWAGRQAGQSDAAALDLLRSRRYATTQAQQKLETFLNDVDCSRQLLWRLVRCGWAPEVIDTTARRLRADLVVVGNVGRAGVPYVELGHVAEQVLRMASSDVLIVRPDYFRFEPIQTAVRALDVEVITQTASEERR